MWNKKWCTDTYIRAVSRSYVRVLLGQSEIHRWYNRNQNIVRTSHEGIHQWYYNRHMGIVRTSISQIKYQNQGSENVHVRTAEPMLTVVVATTQIQNQIHYYLLHVLYRKYVISVKYVCSRLFKQSSMQSISVFNAEHELRKTKTSNKNNNDNEQGDLTSFIHISSNRKKDDCMENGQLHLIHHIIEEVSIKEKPLSTLRSKIQQRYRIDHQTVILQEISAQQIRYNDVREPDNKLADIGNTADHSLIECSDLREEDKAGIRNAVCHHVVEYSDLREMKKKTTASYMIRDSATITQDKESLVDTRNKAHHLISNIDYTNLRETGNTLPHIRNRDLREPDLKSTRSDKGVIVKSNSYSSMVKKRSTEKGQMQSSIKSVIYTVNYLHSICS
mmetsp:Transcript_13652/g.16579  ORF Transcript_13652/g.16579 Transcript_13652/m.16579 type:complete len:389 (+) Transcript_13652:900-2066(+)